MSHSTCVLRLCVHAGYAEWMQILSEHPLDSLSHHENACQPSYSCRYHVPDVPGKAWACGLTTPPFSNNIAHQSAVPR